MKRLQILFVLILFTTCCLFPGLVFSLDFGLLVDQRIEAENKLFTYTPGFIPWFSWNGGQDLSAYLSGIFSFKYNNYGGDMADYSGWTQPALVFELSRFMMNYRINSALTLDAGRMGYTDVLGFAASGLFDGVHAEMATAMGSLNGVLFYSGLMYKETAKILMTKADKANLAKPWGSEDFGSYFASRRLLTAARWDMPLKETITLSAEFLAQFDLNSTDDKLHSQYTGVLMEFYPMSMLRLTFGALLNTQGNGDSIGASFGALARAKMDVPGILNDWMGATIKFTSGSEKNDLNIFTPISAVSQGSVYTGTNDGLMLIGVDYSIRIINSLFAEGALRYFIRTYEDAATDGSLYGGELWATLAWQPFDDIRATLGCGAFFPGMGNVYPSGTDVMWKINAAVLLSF